MDKHLTALRLYLRELGLTAEAGDSGAGRVVHQAVYLAQAAGAELNYEFTWHGRVPFDDELFADYNRLAAELRAGAGPPATATPGSGEPSLRAPVGETLRRIAPALDRPAGFPLDRAAWAELLAATHFLRAAAGLDQEATGRALLGRLPEVAPYADLAVSRLAEHGLLPRNEATT